MLWEPIVSLAVMMSPQHQHCTGLWVNMWIYLAINFSQFIIKCQLYDQGCHMTYLQADSLHLLNISLYLWLPSLNKESNQKKEAFDQIPYREIHVKHKYPHKSHRKYRFLRLSFDLIRIWMLFQITFIFWHYFSGNRLQGLLSKWCYRSTSGWRFTV